MNGVDLEALVEAFNRELRHFRPDWQSRIDPGADRKSARLWANGYLLVLELTENHLEPGKSGEGSRRYDQIRMVILRDSRDPLDEATWTGGALDRVDGRFWQSVIRGSHALWSAEGMTEITVEQVFSEVRAAFTRAIEEGAD